MLVPADMRLRETTAFLQQDPDGQTSHTKRKQNQGQSEKRQE